MTRIDLSKARLAAVAHFSGAVGGAILVVASGFWLASPACAAPITQDEASTRAEQNVSATPAAPEPAPSREAPQPSVRTADSVRERPRLGATPGADSHETTGNLRATVAERRGAAPPVEENPRVDVLDVVESVLESAIGATPWLHVGSHRPVEHRHRPDGGNTGDVPPEAASRLDYSVYGEGARVADAGEGDAPRMAADSLSNPVREAVQLVRQLIGHPITWVIGALALLASLTLAVVRGRGK